MSQIVRFIRTKEEQLPQEAYEVKLYMKPDSGDIYVVPAHFSLLEPIVSKIDFDFKK